MFTLNEVREYYQNEIMLNDKAHDLEHVDGVYERSMEIKNTMYPNLKIDHLVLLASYIHDLKCHEDRKVHHELACEYIIEYRNKDKFLHRLSLLEISMLIDAVYKHRASLRYVDRSNPLTKILYAGDKDEPDIDVYINRSLDYYCGKPTAIEEVVEHLHDKFGTKGYNKFNDIFIDMYGQDKINLLMKNADNCRIVIIDGVKQIVY